MTRSLDFALARQAALEVVCDYCHAPPGQPCVDRYRDNRELTHFPAHLDRMRRRPARTGTDEELSLEQQRRAQAEAELAAIQPQLPEPEEPPHDDEPPEETW